MAMFVVKRLGKNGMWSAVSLIDRNGSFRGEAKFETREEAEIYMTDYLQRMKSRIKYSPEGYGDVKIFDESKPEKEVAKPKPTKPAKSRKKRASKK
jgi:hypothetical protein